MGEDKVIKIAPEHIERGIQKYNGVLDPYLQKFVSSAGLSYTPYRFSDGRILLVLPDNIAAFLYPDEDTFLTTLQME